MSNPFTDSLEISTKGRNALVDLGLQSVEQLLALTFLEVIALPNVGRKTWHEIQDLQETYGKPNSESRDFAQLDSLLVQVNQLLNKHRNFKVQTVSAGVLRATKGKEPQ
jgi:DNA-directed RNA polymerase alpha subunit